MTTIECKRNDKEQNNIPNILWLFGISFAIASIIALLYSIETAQSFALDSIALSVCAYVKDVI